MAAYPTGLKLHLEAESELQASVSFYRERGGDQVAERFKEHVENGFRQILANPARFPPCAGLRGVHEFRLKHFPFALLYLKRADYVWIVAVAHGSRRPGYWTDRLA